MIYSLFSMLVPLELEVFVNLHLDWGFELRFVFLTFAFDARKNHYQVEHDNEDYQKCGVACNEAFLSLLRMILDPLLWVGEPGHEVDLWLALLWLSVGVERLAHCIVDVIGFEFTNVGLAIDGDWGAHLAATLVCEFSIGTQKSIVAIKVTSLNETFIDARVHFFDRDVELIHDFVGAWFLECSGSL